MRNELEVERIKATYKKGAKVRLRNMYGEPQMPAGLKGKVEFVDDIGQIHVRWENGSSLALNKGVDSFELIGSETIGE
jgi:hypothetical protein